LTKREKLFQEAETILVRDAMPIIPVYFYAGVNYFDTNKIQGIYQNVLDDHPLQYIRKIGRGPSRLRSASARQGVESRGP